MTKIKIVGAGIAGLTAGIYACLAGFEDVEILESHDIPGGFCTSWSRKGYRIEGGMHWLTGSAPDSPLYPLWREVGALEEDTPVHLRDPFLVYQGQDERICLYRDPDKLEAHLMEIAPQDASAIKSLVKDIKKLGSLGMPIQDLKGVAVQGSAAATGKDMLKMLPALPRMQKLSKIWLSSYTEAFSHPGLRAALNSVVPEGYAASGLVVTLATLARGDGGYVEGGSTAMAERMAQRFHALGGRIRYGSQVEQIWHDFGSCRGIMVGGKLEPADAVVVTQDARSAIDELFSPPLRLDWMEDMRDKLLPQTCDFISLGVEGDLSDWPEMVVFPLEKPFAHGDRDWAHIGFNNYASYPGYAPSGCSTLTTALMWDGYGYWRQAEDEGKYRERKEELGQKILAALEQAAPELAGKASVLDVATPLSYARYCGSYHGSWMSYMPPGADQNMAQQSVSTISGLYFAGQRIMLPGGMPVALASGRTAAQLLCKQFDKVFVGA